MPTPVLEVPVDDTDFKAFVEIFHKYQSELKAQPAAWKGVNEGISQSKESISEFSASMDTLVNAVTRLTEAEDLRENKRQKSEELKKRDSERKKREEEEDAERQRSVINRVREYSRNVGDAVKKGGSWVGNAAEGALGGITGGAAGLFGGVAGVLKGIPLVGGLAGGLAMAGYEAMSSLNNTQRAAHGMGIDTQTLQAWQTSKLGHMLSQGSVEGLLNTVSEAKASPNGGGMFGKFGIRNYGNRDVSDLSGEMLTNAQAFLKKHPGDQGMWRAKNMYGGALDTGTLRILQQMSPKELQDSLKEMKQFANDHKEADKAATDATTLLAEAEQKATGMLDKFGAGMTQALDQVVAALKDLFDVIQPFLNVKKDWQKFKDNITHPLGGLTSDGKPISGHDAMAKVYNDTVGFIGDVITAPGKALADMIKNPFGHSLADRNNNPGNIMHHGHYDRYASREAGFSAMAQQLQIDYNKHGAHTIAALINGNDHPWASEHAPGNTHASTMAYIDKVSRAVGVGANQNVNLNDTNVLAKVAKAMYEFESGHKAGLPTSDTGHVAKAVAHAVEKGVVKAHKSLGHHKVQVKTQQKPGSDVTVSARQLAGNR